MKGEARRAERSRAGELLDRYRHRRDERPLVALAVESLCRRQRCHLA